jgi:hypothetical protein
MRTRSLAAPLLSLAALPLLVGGGTYAVSAAAAEAAVHRDATGDAVEHVDITQVTTSVVGRADSRLRVVVEFAGTQRGGDHTAMYFDLNRENRGPELRMSGSVDSENSLMRVDGWTDPGREFDCDYRFGQNRATTAITAEIDLDCLGDRPVRFEIRTIAVDSPSSDWLGERRRFTTYRAG